MTQECGRAVKLPLSAALGIDSNVSLALLRFHLIRQWLITCLDLL